jgi:hypothetical protein
MNLQDFATEKHPLRASRVPSLMECNWKEVMQALELVTDNSGKAADTGSAVHKAAQAWHTVLNTGKDDRSAAVWVMRQVAGSEFPQADLDEAERLFRFYANDPRNHDEQVYLTEQKVVVRLPHAEDDPTKQDVYVQGTLDQIRKVGHQYRLVDLKTGQLWSGSQMTMHHAFQLGIYQMGAREFIPHNQTPDAYVCRVRDYDKKRVPQGQVFYPCPWSPRQLEALMTGVAQVVSLVRQGITWPKPGDHCRWCPSGGLSACLSMLEEMCQANPGSHSATQSSSPGATSLFALASSGLSTFSGTGTGKS